MQEDNKEAVKGIVEKFEGLLEKSEINEWVTWMMTPEKQHEKQERLEESIIKFDELMNDKVTLDAFLENGALKARDVAQKVLKRTRNKLGLK